MWYQKTLTLSAKSRGFHLVTDEILNQLADMPRVNIGLLHLLHKGRIQTGTWQGIWLGEHRIHGGSRRIIATLQGE